MNYSFTAHIKDICYYIILIYFICIPFFSLTDAISISELNTEINIDYDDVAEVHNFIKVDTTNSSDYIYIPIYGPRNIFLMDKEYELKYVIMSNFLLVKPRELTKDYEINLRYSTTELISKNKNIWTLVYSLPPSNIIEFDDTKHAGLIISFPRTTKLISIPEHSFIFYDSGHLKLGMNLNLSTNRSTDLEINYEIDSVALKEREQKNELIIHYVISLLTLALLFVFANKIYNKYFLLISKGKKAIIKTLNDKEKIIVELLLRNKNEMTQAAIYKKIDYSKSTLSHVTDKLEQRNILKKIARGNVNRIRLTDWFLKQ